MLLRSRLSATVLAVLLTFATASGAFAQSGTLSEIHVHGSSLEDNLLGFSAERSVYVYLPPGYASASERRFPVLYLLHGIGDHNTAWVQAWSEEHSGYATIQDLMDRGIRDERLAEMIVVMPDARTPFFGCFYTNSPVKGRWSDFIASDLVSYIDAHYRTIAKPEARGVAGHSMGGHGALKLGMLRPEVFSVVYGMNSALLAWGEDISAANPAFANLTAVKTPEEVMQAGLYVAAVIGVGQAFSPNRDNRPFLTDYPFAMKDGHLADNGPGWDRWQKQMPVFMVDDHAENLRKLRAIRFDSAFVDEFAHIPSTSKQFSDALTRAGIAHTFEMYNGDHRNRVWGRTGRLYTEALPYFSDHLAPVAEALASSAE